LSTSIAEPYAPTPGKMSLSAAAMPAGVVHGLDREPEGLDGVADAPDVAGAVVQEGHLAFGFSRGDEDGRAARYGRDAGDGAAAERARGALELRERGGGGDGCREHGGVA
jgi:hypothetical protein